MAWRIVVQPDGKYARFSDIVDMFTEYDMTRDEAFDCCLEYVGRKDAEGKIGRAEANPARWLDELETIKRVHGDEYCSKVIQAIVGKDPEAQAWLQTH